MKLQRDSNSDRRSRRWAHWPLDHHRGPIITNFSPEISQGVQGSQILLDACVSLLNLPLDDVIHDVDLRVLLDALRNDLRPRIREIQVVMQFLPEKIYSHFIKNYFELGQKENDLFEFANTFALRMAQFEFQRSTSVNYDDNILSKFSFNKMFRAECPPDLMGLWAFIYYLLSWTLRDPLMI